MSGQKRSLWDIAVDQQNNVHLKKGDAADNQPCHSYIFVCGSRNSGKTTLIQRFLDREEPAKVTPALDFYYGRRSKQNNMANVKDVVQIWELGGGSKMTKLIDTIISPSNIKHFKVVLMLDLSNPKTLWNVQHSLINQLNKKIAQVIKEIGKTNKQFEKDLKQEAWARIGVNHKDKNMITPFLLPLVIIGSKFDVFQQEVNTDEKVIVLKTLRFLAHSNGAMLQVCSTKAEGLTGRAKSILSHMAFGTSLSKTTSLDVSKPLVVPFGQDSFEDIGAPPVSKDILMKLHRGGSPYELWRDAYNHCFPSETEEKDNKTNPTLDPQFANDLVDDIRKQKDQELDRYRKLSERKIREVLLDATAGKTPKQNKKR